MVIDNGDVQDGPAVSGDQQAWAASEPDTETLDVDINSDDLDHEDFLRIYEQTLKNFEEGEVVKGTVVAVDGDSVLIDIGFKSEGCISLNEFPSADDVKVGEEFDVFIETAEDQDGNIVLSKMKADRIKNWTKVQRHYENNEIIEGRILKKVKGGLKVDVGLDAFLPASQVAPKPPEDIDQLIGRTCRFRIIKLTKRRRNVVLSRRQVLEEEQREQKRQVLENLQIGQLLTGVVKNITDFGAFVDVGGIDGLLHITDMSWGRIRHPSEVVSVGDQLEVLVLNFNREEEKISLGLKQKTPSPWTHVEQKYPAGSVLQGRVVSMTDYGAFVELEKGVEGMVHVSEMSWTKRVRHPSEIVVINDNIEVKVLGLNIERQKISLGIKQVSGSPWQDLAEKYPPGTVLKGLVRNLADYGAFVQIEPGIDGLLHVSDMSWTQKVSHPSEILKKGDEIDVQVLDISPDQQKISLGLKQLLPDPWLDVPDRYHKGEYIKVVISKLVSFGAFARLDNGVEGLIHISELAENRVAKPEDVVSVDDELWVKVLSVDGVARKIGLSIKHFLRDAPPVTEEPVEVEGEFAEEDSVPEPEPVETTDDTDTDFAVSISSAETESSTEDLQPETESLEEPVSSPEDLQPERESLEESMEDSEEMGIDSSTPL